MGYTLLSETVMPNHDDNDESMTVVRIYDIDEDTYDFLYCVRCYERNDGTYGPHNPAPSDVVEVGCVEYAILEALRLTSDTYAAPGAMYKMYDATMFGRVVIVTETTAYNV